MISGTRSSCPARPGGFLHGVRDVVAEPGLGLEVVEEVVVLVEDVAAESGFEGELGGGEPPGRGMQRGSREEPGCGRLDGGAFGISAYVHISAEMPVMPGISGSALLRKPHFTAVLAKLQ
jgi:hypothetical protein